MGYCEVEDVLAMLKKDMMSVILGEDYTEDETLLQELMMPYCETAIADAGAEIDGYIGKRYRVPLAAAPPVLQKYAKDIAVYNLVSRTGIDESKREKTILNRYNAAIRYLELVAKGSVDIGVDEGGSGSGTDPAEDAAIGFRIQSNNRLFSRDSMRRW